MDTDFHHIFSEDALYINPPKEVIIGNKAWVGFRSLILKGVEMAESVIVAANTTLTMSINSCNSIIGGTPVNVLRERVKWRL